MELSIGCTSTHKFKTFVWVRSLELLKQRGSGDKVVNRKRLMARSFFFHFFTGKIGRLWSGFSEPNPETEQQTRQKNKTKNSKKKRKHRSVGFGRVTFFSKYTDYKDATLRSGKKTNKTNDRKTQLSVFGFPTLLRGGTFFAGIFVTATELLC